MTDQRICCGTIAIIYTYTQTLNAKPNTSLVFSTILGMDTKQKGKNGVGPKWG